MAITLYEPFRAVFYTGFYLAHALETYEQEGLDVELAAPPDFNGAVRSLLAGEVDVIWSGPKSLLDYHNRDADCPMIGFCEVVRRDPFVLVGREPRPDFRFADLQNCRLGTVAEVPTPWMCLQDDIRRAGLDPASLDRVDDHSMAQNMDALRAGDLDVIQLFEPHVETLVQEGAGHIWYAAASRGPTAYTTLITTRAVLDRDPELLRGMACAIHRAQTWLHSHDATEVSDRVADFFPNIPSKVLTGAIGRYKALSIWAHEPAPSTLGFVRLKCSLLSGNFIDRDVPYDNCLTKRFASDLAAGNQAT